MKRLEIKYLNIKDIKAYNKNPRKNEQAIPFVMESIKQFGFKNPIIIDKNNVIVCGHTRYRSAEKLGIKEIPCVYADDLTEEQVKAFRIADNKVSEKAEWDLDLLNEELDDILNIDMDLLGFDEELDIDDEEQKEIEEVDVPEPPKVAKTKMGDIYQLGEHRLMCGDSTSKECVDELMDGNKADLLFTDPPYNVSFEDKSKNVLKRQEYSHIENDNLSMDDFKAFLGKVFTNANNSLNDDASYYVFSCQDGDNEMMMMMMRENGLKCRHQIIWVKEAPVFSMGRLDYDYKHEPILYGWKKKHNFYRKGDQDKSVWEYNRTSNKLHPTMKPVELIGNALKNSTKQNDLVIDLFGGSGSTLIACEQLNRKCYMMELDPKYCDVIIKRWETLTGGKAELIKGGK